MNFVKYFFLAGMAAFVLGFLALGVVHLLYHPYPVERMFYGSVGCGLGTGLVNGVVAQIRLAG